MRNILRENFQRVWNGTDKVNENRNGGVALWTTPPLVYNAHNPAMFIREKYMHVANGYEPPFEKKPCYVSIDNTAVKYTFGVKTGSPIYIRASTDKGEVLAKVKKGSKEVDMSGYCSKIYDILSISLTEESYESTPPEDYTCIYLKPGEVYNGELYICKDKDNIIYRNTGIDTSDLTFYFDDGTTTTLTAESFGGKTMFNAGEVSKMRFMNSLASFGTRGVIPDAALYVRHTVSSKVTGRAFIAVNGVSQIGRSQDRTGEGGKILTTLEKLRYYDGYPLDYTVMSAEREVETANGTAQIGTISRVLVQPESQKPLKDEAGSDVLVQRSEQVLLGFDIGQRIYRMDTPRSPFYIRWINSLGGVDYFMFGKTQKQTRAVKSVSTYSPFIENTEYAATNRVAYAMSTEAEVTVGASQLSKKEFDALQSVPFSPLIERYDETETRWIRLAVEKFEGSIDTKGERFSVEITFTLPTINVQY